MGTKRFKVQKTVSLQTVQREQIFLPSQLNERTNHSFNWLYAQLHFLLNLSQLLVSCLSLLDKLINPGVPDLSSHGNNNQTPELIKFGQ